MPTGCMLRASRPCSATRTTMCSRPTRSNEWISPPFEPTERNNNIYARGAVDDKGQLWMEIKAVEALMKGHDGKLPAECEVHH